MSADERLEDLAGAVLDGSPIDWGLAETGSVDTSEEAGLRGLREIERIAVYNRTLQRQPGGPSVTPPEHWGHLTLLERAREGASGEIWRAWDPVLQREVALKFLRIGDSAADDRALLEEARALARVRHPGVVAVHGLAEHAGRIGMWMELLTGETLEVEMARRGKLPPSEVARIGLEVSRALEAIAAAGLVHRDIKPANIILESSGRIVLTDFGLGHRIALSEHEPWRSSGTPMFMSPERLAGQPATPRSDLYALGVTLRWALTGRCPFQVRTLEELKHAVEAGPPESLSSARSDAPQALVDAIDGSMAASIESRYSGAGQLTDRLEQALEESNAETRSRIHRRRLVAAAAAVVFVGAVAVLVPKLAERPAASHPAQFTVAQAPGTVFTADTFPVVSPDGRLVAYQVMDTAGVLRLWIRPVASLDARALEGTEGGVLQFWSPDSRYLGFFADGKLKKVSVAGGASEVLCPAADPRGAAWGKDGVIVFVPSVAGPLYRVSAEGGVPTELLRPDSTRHETALRWPQFLPDGKRFFFVALPPRDGVFDVFVSSPNSKERRRVMSAGCAPVCAGDEGVIVASNGRLMFQKFDYRRLRPKGAPIALGVSAFSDVSVGMPLASASMNGVLVYLNQVVTNTRFYWLDRSGKRIGRFEVPEGRYERSFFSPDGKRILAERRDSPNTMALWMIDVNRGEARRFSQGTQSRIGGAPVWSPDGSRIAFNSNRSGRTYIYQRSVADASDEELLYQSPGQFNEVIGWSPDGRYLLLEEAGQTTGWDLWLLPMEGKREAIPYVKTRFNELGGAISPDGRWLAYSSDASGRSETHVRSFPKPGAEHLASTQPGGQFWTTKNELLIIDITGIYSVPVTTTPTFQAGKTRLLFRYPLGALFVSATPSGDRFIESIPSDSESRTISVHLDYLARVDR